MSSKLKIAILLIGWFLFSFYISAVDIQKDPFSFHFVFWKFGVAKVLELLVLVILTLLSMGVVYVKGHLDGSRGVLNDFMQVIKSKETGITTEKDKTEL